MLLATDGSHASLAALRWARLYTAKGEWEPEVLTVCEPLPLAVGELALPTPASGFELAMRHSTVARIRKQLRRARATGWTQTVKFGRVAQTLTATAREGGAELIVLGLGKHGRLARLVGSETVVRVARHSQVPVLAVHSRARSLPRVALVALDFGESSLAAAHEALGLLGPSGRLHLLHVKWTYNTTSIADSEWESAYAAAVEHEFARVRQQLGAHPDIAVTTEVRAGGVVENVLAAAKAIHAQLIAVGSSNQTMLDRLIIGSTSAQMLRAADCSVLVVPAALSN